MKKIILTLMSLAVLSNAANLFADKTVNVINNSDYNIVLSNRAIKKNAEFQRPPQFSEINTISPHTNKFITFLDNASNGNQINYILNYIIKGYPTITNTQPDTTNYQQSFNASAVKGDIVFN